MKKIIKKLLRMALSPFVLGDFLRFKSVASERRFDLNFSDVYPCIKDKTIKTGFDRHYVYHTAWAARKVREINPAHHTDISSSLYFAGLVSAFVPVKFFDYRPADLSLSNLESKEADLLSLPFADNSIDSLSCMHVIEHIGMGRYGEKMDYDGDLKAIKELKRVLAGKGNLLFVAPIGKSAKIEFNAHRIYTYKMIMSIFSDLSLKEFALIPEASGAMLTGQEAIAKTEQENYACGCFWFVKS